MKKSNGKSSLYASSRTGSLSRLNKSREKKKRVKTVHSYTVRTRRGKNDYIDKTNQDSFVALPNFNQMTDTHIFGVYDGHGIPTFNNIGVNGHLVSNYVTANIGRFFTENKEKLSKKNKEAWFSTY